MANARSKKTKKKKVSKKKTATKKVTARKAKVKSATKSKTASSFKITLTSIYKNIDLLRIEIAGIKELMIGTGGLAAGQTPIATKTTTKIGDAEHTQIDLFENTKANGKKALSKDDVSNALQEVMTVEGEDAVVGILAQFKAKRVSDIKTKDYTATLEACNVLMSGTTPAESNSSATDFL